MAESTRASVAALQKVVILGGGISSITAALKLTEDPNWTRTFKSITLYQLGWRLGGKGATGRGPHDRIQEHGLHIWPGFYENSFQVIKKVYEDLKRPADAPLACFEQAFSGHDCIGVADKTHGRWHPRVFDVPKAPGCPGDGASLPSLAKCRARMAEWLAHHGRQHIHDDACVQTLQRIKKLANAEPGTPEGDALVSELRNFLDWMQTNLQSERLGALGWDCWGTLLATAAVISIGLIVDRIDSSDDLVRLEGVDFARWLDRHQPFLSNVSDLRRNPFLRGLYDFAFAYENGDITKPNFSTSPALRTIYRMCFTYKGSIFYKMEAGMGDTIFAPAYELLRQRGVQFEFFHRVKNLKLSSDKLRIEEIELGVQATVTTKPYNPLQPVVSEGYVGDLPCWPAHPLYCQLNEGADLQSAKIDLESFWTPWTDVGNLRLFAGTHFDVVVFGIPIGSIPYVCAELVQELPDWRRMVANVKTVQTQGVQVWFSQSLADLGWPGAPPILDAWIQPLNTWADMTNLLEHKRENWPVGSKPLTLAYFCGPMKGDIPDPSRTRFPMEAYQEVFDNAKILLTSSLSTLWIGPTLCGSPEDCMQAIYCRPNIDPSERYVLSLAGSADFRLKADQSGLTNLIITGDWIDNGYNGGCIEASTWAGLQAANVVFGRPINEGVVR